MATSGLCESFHFAQRGSEGEGWGGGEKNPQRGERDEVWKCFRCLRGEGEGRGEECEGGKSDGGV